MKAKGFTLAELMTTVAIIGFLAALTIPVIVHNIEEHRQRALLRKGIQSLNEAIAVNIAKGRGDLYTYTDRSGVVPGVAGYLIQGIDTATKVKRMQASNNWFSNEPYFETKDGLRFITYFSDTYQRCGTAGIRSIEHSGHAINEMACPILIDTTRNLVENYTRRENIIVLCRENLFDYVGGSIVGDCHNTTPGLYIVYLTNNSVYVPERIQNFLDNKQ